MGCIEQTLPPIEGILLLCLFSLLLLLKPVLFEPAIEVSPASLAKLETMAIVAAVPHYFVLEPVFSIVVIPSISLPLSYFLSNSYPV